MHQLLKFIFGIKLYMFRTGSCQQNCMTYTIAVFTVENS